MVALVISTVFTYYYFLYTNEYPQGSYEKIASYSADKVFQTRLLVTTIANFLVPSIPLIEFCFQWLVPYPITYEVILQILNISFLIILLYTIPSFLNNLGISINPWISFLIMIPLSWNYIVINGMLDGAGLYYPYDIPSISLFTLGVVLFQNSKWKRFYFIYTIALLNRESACFITITGIFLEIKKKDQGLIQWLNKNKLIFKHVLMQSFLWLSSRIILSWSFKDNPGLFFEQPHSMWEFIGCIITNESHWAMNKPVWFLTLFAGIWIIPIFGFYYLPKQTIKLSFVGLIYLIVLTFRSNMMETRVYNEMNIILFVIVISIFFRNERFKRNE